ncbi:WAT1-related protein [Rhynchospora pubera]|uniref:WAT1-related protein n=1 Tax=Rhynchospora pubera TaxID=906938 RepID=A0AAV8ANS1_9POAL|nr:WAT1-related protein [Rhynchospora pubera]KAJ4801847.1 WAT1-related protein [Rhynchospora pubera]
MIALSLIDVSNFHLKHAEFIPKSQNLKIISIPSNHHSRPNQARGNTETEEREDRMVVFSLEEYKPLLAMVATQSVYAVMNLLTKAALQQGFSNFVFVVYRQSIATLALLPALFFTRGRGITGTSLSFKGCCLIFLAALFGGTGNKVLQYVGLNLGTASLVAVMSNLIPATTFVMAASVGLENVEVKSLRTWAKILGTIVCVGGTMILTFYKGPTILKFSDGSLNLGTALHSVDLGTAFHSVDYKWVLAVGCLLVSTSCWSLWLILQVPICKYIDPLPQAFWLCLLSSLQIAPIVFFLEPNLNTWKINTTTELLACSFAVYSTLLLTNHLSFLIYVWKICIVKIKFVPNCNLITSVLVRICWQIYLK